MINFLSHISHNWSRSSKARINRLMDTDEFLPVIFALLRNTLSGAISKRQSVCRSGYTSWKGDGNTQNAVFVISCNVSFHHVMHSNRLLFSCSWPLVYCLLISQNDWKKKKENETSRYPFISMAAMVDGGRHYESTGWNLSPWGVHVSIWSIYNKERLKGNLAACHFMLCQNRIRSVTLYNWPFTWSLSMT